MEFTTRFDLGYYWSGRRAALRAHPHAALRRIVILALTLAVIALSVIGMGVHATHPHLPLLTSFLPCLTAVILLCSSAILYTPALSIVDYHRAPFKNQDGLILLDDWGVRHVVKGEIQGGSTWASIESAAISRAGIVLLYHQGSTGKFLRFADMTPEQRFSATGHVRSRVQTVKSR